ncbi:MAG: hypothetical protein NVV72_04685 [Asticcacaulis sp.]|nr:hypothetical protein [Asticcacaulis sp.]
METTAILNGFIRRDLVIDGPVLIRVNGPADGPMPWEAAPPIAIHDARALQTGDLPVDAFLAANGFALTDHVSQVADWDSGASQDQEKNDILRVYMPEIEALIRDRLLPGRRLEIRQGPYLVRRGPGSNPYAQGVHQDHGLTPDDYMESLEAFSTPEYAQSWRARYDQPDVAGYMVLNFWRTVYMDQPLRHMPLAICHPASVAPDDLVPAALVDFAPSGKNTNQLSLRYNPEHRWHYYPDMTTGEVLVFKIFEHFKEAPEAGLKTVFHTAFAHPETPADAPERQSCEHRVGVFILKD